MLLLSAENITLIKDRKTLVRDASFGLQSGQLTALLGPNGAGKSSLLKAATGIVKVSSGTVKIGGKNVSTLSAMERARKLAYLPQVRELAWPSRVRDVVALGRYPYGVCTSRPVASDANAINKALAACDLSTLETRSCDTLSGGELARVHCARALASEAPVLIADEPTAALDPRHAFEIMALLQAHARRGGAALVVLHDVALAARYADQLIWMQHGQIVANGRVEETLTENRMADIFRVRARVMEREVTLLGPI